MSSLCYFMVVVTVMVGMLTGISDARKNKEHEYYKNITHCGSGSDMGSFDWNAYRGRWYVSRVSNPVSPMLREVSGYAVDIDVSSIEPNARDKAWRDATVDRKETLVLSDSRKCRKRSWRCVREQGTSETVCSLGGDGVGGIVQKSVVMATDYISTAAVYRETFVNNNLISRQVNLMVRNRNMDPDPSVIEAAMNDFCGPNAAKPNSEFYKSISNGSDRSCFLP